MLIGLLSNYGQIMIRDKITEGLKSIFKEEISKSREDGKERGFFLCLNNELSASETCVGNKCGITLTRPRDACPGKVQGDFHTHPRLNYIKEELRKINIQVPPDSKIIDEQEKDIKEKGWTAQTPSYKDLLYGLNMRFFGDSKGTTCVGVDYNDTKVECWTPKNVPHNAYIRANDELTKGGKDFDSVPKKWIIPLFEKEIIYLE
jgi:hypothetical protein